MEFKIYDSGEPQFALFPSIIAQATPSAQELHQPSDGDASTSCPIIPGLTDCLSRIEQRYGLRGDLAIFILSLERRHPTLLAGVGGAI